MTETQLESELRATFRAAAETVPAAPDLAPRATEGVRRDRRSWTASGAAVVAVVAAAVAGTALDGGGPVLQPEPASAPSPSSAAPSGPSVATVQGEWRAVRINGFHQLRARRPEQPLLMFNPDGTWSGSDGCNSLSGTYAIGPNGELSTTNNGQRLAGCHNVPHIEVLATASRIEVTRPAIRFYDQNGQELASYSRVR